MRATKRQLAALLFLGAMVGCGLDLAGLEITTDGMDGGVGGEGGVVGPDASLDGSPANGDGGVTVDGCVLGTGGCVLVPPGWNLVGFASTTDAGCPPGLASPSTDVLEGPTAPAGACACGTCAVTTPPTCTGKVDIGFDIDGTHSCAFPGAPSSNANNPAGGCGQDLFLGTESSGIEAKLTPTPPDGGVCASSGVLQKANVIYAAKGRVCTPASPAAIGCAGSTCTPSLAAPFGACIAQAGDQACPAGNFSVKHLVGTDVTANCGTCGCSMTGACAGTYTLYTDTGCAVNPTVLTVNGTCVRNAAMDGQSYKSYRYALSPTGVGCTATGTAPVAQNVALVGSQTVCCPP